MMEDKKRSDDEDLLFLKAKTFFEKKILVHLTKKGGEWLNGEIKEVKVNFLMIDERKKGLIPVFYIELDKIEKLEDRR